MDPTLRLGPLLLGDEEITLAAGLLDLVVQLTERALEVLCFSGLSFPGLLEDHRAIGVLLLTQQCLLREVIASFLDRQHRSVLPVALLFDLGLKLCLELPLIGDGRSHITLGTRQLLAHVQNDLIEHLFGIFRPRDEIVDVRFNDRRQLREDAHRLALRPVGEVADLLHVRGGSERNRLDRSLDLEEVECLHLQRVA